MKRENDNTIQYFKSNGELVNMEELTNTNLGNINGMLLKCLMKNGNVEIGYADSFKSHKMEEYDGNVSEYIYLWTWDNVDEEEHKLIGNDKSKFNQSFRKLYINDINSIKAILHSNSRWGGRITNKFHF